ncbi:NADPH2 dehydrogenase [Stagonosporopsis vannaccii]|nr:NADPH2 dehydrogenase [Stagonosporopsis vannaccii]
MEMSRLFQPLILGPHELKHRIAMAPLTRYRMDDDWTLLTEMQEYYEQRACVSGTLIVSEATIIARNAAGCYNAPGIWSKAQIEAWKKITTAVHAKGCVIYCQLWHQGRAAHPNVLEAQGYKLLSSSDVPISAQEQRPTAMTETEIVDTIADYAAAAKNAIAAGFDGVEIHGANGYLPDQFLQTTCNRRSDRWGGSIENRARFHIEVTKAVISSIGAQRTAIRLSPYSDFNGMLMQEPEPTFEYLLAHLKPLGLSYLHLIEARITGNDDADCGGQNSVAWVVTLWNNTSPIVLAGGFKPLSARDVVDDTYKDHDVIVAFGRYFVANPDLVFRVKERVPLTGYDRGVFYTPKVATGYVDYPHSEQFLQSAKA